MDIVERDNDRVALVTGSGGMYAGAALAAMLGSPGITVAHIARDPWEELNTIRRILDTRPRPSFRSYRGKPSPVPTNKRAKVKAARKANVRRISKSALTPPLPLEGV